MDTEEILRIEAELKNLSLIRRFVEEKVTALDADPDVIADVLLATDEATTNAIVHGYQDEPGIIEIEVRQTGDALVIHVRDQAPPFDPTAVPPPDLSLPLEQRPYGGMGVHLIRQLMDEVTHRITPQGGNELTMTKKGIV